MKRPTLYAVLLGAGYALVGGTYIFVSSHLAASSSRSVEELRLVEMVKGAGYIVVTASLIAFAARELFSRIQRDSDELLRRQQAIVSTERRVYAGLIASSIAHDSNNVLTQVMGELELLRKTADPAERKATHQRIDTAVDRVISLNRRLQSAGLQAARSTRERFELGQMVATIVHGLKAHPKLRLRQVSVERAQRVEVELEPVVVDQIVTNLLLNAADATEENGQVKVSVGRDQKAFVEVHDDGPGVPVDRRPGLFTALETTKPDGNGLGLFSVEASAKSVGGTVSVGDSPLGGARFRVELPLSS